MMQRGRLYENSLMQYKIPTREDIGHIHVESLRAAMKKSGPFGAKSIGEVIDQYTTTGNCSCNL